MSLSLAYNVRHVLARRASTAMTVGGIALVVAVFVAARMMVSGLEQALAATGSPDNIIILRAGARNEVQSGISRPDSNAVLADAAIARAADGEPLASPELLLLVVMKRARDLSPTNINLRGVSPRGFELRPQVLLREGRLPSQGTREVIVGRALREQFSGTAIGDGIRLAGAEWPVVGVFDAGESASNSEIWGDVDQLMASARRDAFSSITLRLSSPSKFDELRTRLESDRRFNLSVMREQELLRSQSEFLAIFISVLGGVVSIIFSLGAIIGGTVTMYSAVAHRTREIGILRALGFTRSAILRSFVQEALLLGLAGGMVGILIAALLSGTSLSTTNFATFSEIAFHFRFTPAAAASGLLFALIMGLVGGLLPAISAARLDLRTSLRRG